LLEGLAGKAGGRKKPGGRRVVIDFFLNLVPPEATAQHKGVSVRGGRAHVFTKQVIKDIEAAYCAALAPHRPAAPLKGPVRAHITFTFPWRESEPAKNKAWGWLPKPTKSDADNIYKLFGDCLGTVGFFAKGDEQIADLRILKGWGDRPGIRVRLSEWEPGTD
jgi:crossover junction endodeoxyribonuclease RusA